MCSPSGLGEGGERREAGAGSGPALCLPPQHPLPSNSRASHPPGPGAPCPASHNPATPGLSPHLWPSAQCNQTPLPFNRRQMSGATQVPISRVHPLCLHPPIGKPNVPPTSCQSPPALDDCSTLIPWVRPSPWGGEGLLGEVGQLVQCPVTPPLLRERLTAFRRPSWRHSSVKACRGCACFARWATVRGGGAPPWTPWPATWGGGGGRQGTPTWPSVQISPRPHPNTLKSTQTSP